MESDALIDYLLSPAYVAAMRALAFVCVIATAALVALSLAHYGRARETGHTQEAPWVLIVATLRDSFLLTLLYTADTLLYRASDARSGLMAGSDMGGLIFPLIATYGGIVTQALIAAISILRILAISKWLKAASERRS